MFHRSAALLLLFVTWVPLLWGQDAGQQVVNAEQDRLPEIADEPKFVDPSTLMPDKLAAKVTADFSDASLLDLVEWLRREQDLAVLLEENALADIDMLPSDPIVDRLDDVPLYLLLNRLRFRGIDWYYEDDVLHLTSPDVAEEKLLTIPYNVGDLLDQGYEVGDLEAVVTGTIAPDTWEDLGGNGVLSFLGDVVFVRQTGAIQRRVQGMLMGLRKHGRQTFIFDPPQHRVLRQKLTENVSVDFSDTPFDKAVAELAERVDADIRLDIPALRQSRIREREPVTLALTDRRLDTVLEAMVLNLNLTWMLQDGVLWITTTDRADRYLKTAIYDVRDLARDESEAGALQDAILSQSNPSAWDVYGGPGALHFARPGTMVVLNHNGVHMEVLRLLESYRLALRESKRRDRNVLDPQEVITVYYRTHSAVAEDLKSVLPLLVRPGSWSSEDEPDAPGEILLSASRPELTDPPSQAATTSIDPHAKALVISRAVLIIRHTREVQEEIAEVIKRVEEGDASQESEADAMGGMGGFGGGFF